MSLDVNTGILTIDGPAKEGVDVVIRGDQIWVETQDGAQHEIKLGARYLFQQELKSVRVEG